MKIFKKIFIVTFALIVFALIGVIVYFWPVDPRLNGTFKSDKEETITYLKSIMDTSERQLNYWNQLYGHLYHVYEGHKTISFSDSHITDVKESVEPPKLDRDKAGRYFFMRRSEIGKDRVKIIIMPSPLWDIESIRFEEIEIVEDGFWLKEGTPIGMKIPLKEKFTKIKS